VDSLPEGIQLVAACLGDSNVITRASGPSIVMTVHDRASTILTRKMANHLFPDYDCTRLSNLIRKARRLRQEQLDA
jgi:hypothetical protein